MPSALKTRSPLAARTPQLVEVSDMTGGLDLRRSPTLVQPTRARTLLNYDLSEPGALTMRPGYTQASTASLGAGRAQGGARVYLASTVFTLLAWSGAVKRPTDAWVFGADVLTGLSTANQVYFPYDRDLVAVMDGTHRPYFSTNGSNWNLMGTDASTTGPTISSAAVSTASLSSGEYALAFTYKHRGTGHESNISPESTLTLTSTANQAISGTVPASTDPKVDAAVIYARHKTPDGESVLRKASSGAVGSSFTITSSNWTTNDEAPTNHTPPVAGLQFAKVWKNRWWAPSGTIGNRLYFTELFLPQAWPSLFFIDIPFEKGDSITNIESIGDTLVVYGQSGAFLIVGQTSLDFEVRPAQGAESGALGPRASMRVEQADIHISGDSIGTFDGGTDRDLEHDIAPAYRDLVTNSASTSLALVAALHDPLRHEARVSVPRVYPTAARGELILNLDRSRENEGTPAWTTTDLDAHLWIHWNGNEPTAGDRGRIFFMPSTSGVVYEANVGASANSSNMTAEYLGPALSMGLHRARVTGLHIEYEPHGGNFTAEVLTDGVSQGQMAVNIGVGLYPYGSTVTYGTATRTYGSQGRKKAFVRMPMTANGRTVALHTIYQGTERFKWFGYAFEILPEPAPRRLSD